MARNCKSCALSLTCDSVFGFAADRVARPERDGPVGPDCGLGGGIVGVRAACQTLTCAVPVRIFFVLPSILESHPCRSSIAPWADSASAGIPSKLRENVEGIGCALKPVPVSVIWSGGGNGGKRFCHLQP